MGDAESASAKSTKVTFSTLPRIVNFDRFQLGGNPNDRDWKRIKCQWSAKRQRFFKERYPHCAKVDKTEEFDEVVNVTTHQFEQIVNEAELGVVLDDSIEGTFPETRRIQDYTNGDHTKSDS